LVFFTGDLTQKGTKEEFEALETTLKDIWNKLAELNSYPQLLVGLQLSVVESPTY
jgi:hypothetical protein